jgi:hypothetical protein
MKQSVVYSAIFGGYDKLSDNQYVIPDTDYLCFTDTWFESNLWKVIIVPPIYEDNTRTARKYKLLPHRFLADYKNSIWIDGNIEILSNPLELFDDRLVFGTFDHMKCFDKRNCIYEEAEAILEMGNTNIRRTPERGIKNWKDNPEIIKKQVNKYKQEGFPSQLGLAVTSVVLRQHNVPSIKKLGEDWWMEMKYGSKRDQLSLNYVAWKNSLDITYIDGDVRSNLYFRMTNGHKGKK